MRRTLRVMIAMALLVGVFAGVGNALTFTCGTDDDNDPDAVDCEGTDDRDVISERRQDDTIDALDGADIVNADEFRQDIDRLFGGANNDRLRTDDGDGQDFINCGPGGDDVAILDRGDNVNHNNCENIRGPGR